MRNFIVAIGVLISGLVGSFAVSATDVVSVVGVQGYDLVSYHTGAKPLQGNGNHVAHHGGVSYLFSSAENRTAFEANPKKYLPAYGGYCAFGVAVGKKFIADPTVWEIVEGTLYLNLDNKVKSIWTMDVPGNIGKADTNWKSIKTIAASDL